MTRDTESLLSAMALLRPRGLLWLLPLSLALGLAASEEPCSGHCDASRPQDYYSEYVQDFDELALLQVSREANQKEGTADAQKADKAHADRERADAQTEQITFKGQGASLTDMNYHVMMAVNSRIEHGTATRSNTALLGITVFVVVMCAVALFVLFSQYDSTIETRKSLEASLEPYSRSPQPQSRFYQSSPGAPPRSPAVPLLPGRQGATHFTPDLDNAVVPPGGRIVLKLPTLMDVPDQHHKKVSTVLTADNQPKYVLKLLKYSHPEIPHEEDVSLSLPSELDEEIVTCVFGRPHGPNLECEIYKGGASLFGGICRDTQNVNDFILWTAPDSITYFKIVVRGRIDDRQVRIVNALDNSEVASCSRGQDREHYQVECRGGAELPLVVVTLVACDRLSAVYTTTI